LLQRAQLGAETSVHAEDLLINDSSDGQTVKAVGEGLPKLDVVAALALIIEAIDTVDGGAFVVSSQEEEVLGVLDLVGEEEADSFEALLSAVHVISEEKVVGIRRETAILE
jgi:hypothetical protein